MQNEKRDVFLIWDSLFAHLKPEFKIKKTLLYNKLAEYSQVMLYNPDAFQNGERVGDVRKFILELTQDPNVTIHPMIWNGCELGCRMFYDILKDFNLDQDTVFIEQGLLPQKDHLRFLTTPVKDEVNYGLPDDPKFYNYTFEKQDVESYITNLLDPIEIKPKSNRVSIVTQISSDSSLFSLNDPAKQIPELVEKKLIEIYEQSKIKDLELILCPHPIWPENYKAYNFDEKYKISTKSTIESCAESELVISYNSTTLCETVARGIPSVALSKDHPLNKTDEYSLLCTIKYSQFKPSEISYKDFLAQKNNFVNLKRNK